MNSHALDIYGIYRCINDMVAMRKEVFHHAANCYSWTSPTSKIILLIVFVLIANIYIITILHHRWIYRFKFNMVEIQSSVLGTDRPNYFFKVAIQCATVADPLHAYVMAVIRVKLLGEAVNPKFRFKAKFLFNTQTCKYMRRKNCILVSNVRKFILTIF